MGKVGISWCCPGLLAGDDTGSVHFVPKCRGKNVVHECRVIGGFGCVSCASKYDNISYKLKTPYLRVCVFIYLSIYLVIWKWFHSPLFEIQYSLSLSLSLSFSFCLCSHHVKSCYIFVLQIFATG